MSITYRAPRLCGSCGAEVSVLVIESANPTRHPPFQAALLARTLLRERCPACGNVQEHYEKFLWTDLPARLCVAVLRPEWRGDWRLVEADARTLLVPLRDEGPQFVRDWNTGVALRVAFGLEELREKVVCRLAGIDDRVLEAIKIERELGDHHLEAAERGHRLLLARGDGTRELGWAEYQTAAGRDRLAAQYPGLFGDAVWVHASRAMQSSAPTRPAAS